MIDGETGLVFRAGSTGNLVSAIRLLDSDQEQMARMGRNARRFTPDKAPDSNETYNTILHLDAQTRGSGEDISVYENCADP